MPPVLTAGKNGEAVSSFNSPFLIMMKQIPAGGFKTQFGLSNL